MSSYESCQIAIRNFKENSSHANVDMYESNVVCSKAKTPCNWVGNGIHFACITNDITNGDVSVVNIYDGLSGGRNSVIVPRKD